jgi:hypothetical protein
MEYLAWPGVVLVLGLVALFMFKRNIAGRIDKIKRIERVGVSMESEQTQSVQESKGSGFQELMGLASSPLLRDRENNIRNELKARGITNEQEIIKILTRACASVQLTLQWEQIEKVIFGSQMAMIVQMNAHPAGLSVGAMKTYFEAAAKQFPEVYANYTFEQYVNYLVSMQLILKGGAGYQVSLEGKEFMVWLVHTGRTHARPN